MRTSSKVMIKAGRFRAFRATVLEQIGAVVRVRLDGETLELDYSESELMPLQYC